MALELGNLVRVLYRRLFTLAHLNKYLLSHSFIFLSFFISDAGPTLLDIPETVWADSLMCNLCAIRIFNSTVTRTHLYIVGLHARKIAWSPWRHVKTLNNSLTSAFIAPRFGVQFMMYIREPLIFIVYKERIIMNPKLLFIQISDLCVDPYHS